MLALLWSARAALVVAALLTARGAFSGPSAGFSLLPWDKAEHILAFFVLTGLSVLSFPGAPLWAVSLGLSLAGAVIELVQGSPWVHRDADLLDWVSEDVAIVAVMGCMVLGALRTRLRAFRPPADATATSEIGGAPGRPSETPSDPVGVADLQQEIDTLRQLLRDVYRDRDPIERDALRPRGQLAASLPQSVASLEAERVASPDSVSHPHD